MVLMAFDGGANGVHAGPIAETPGESATAANPIIAIVPPDFPHSTVINLNRMQNPHTIHVQSRKIHKRRGVCLHPISMNEDTPLAVIQ